MTAGALGIECQAPIGTFFLTFHASGAPKYQGRIIEYPQTGYCLCQLQDWFTGCASKRVLVPVAEVAGWKHYLTEWQWRTAGEFELTRLREAMKAEMEGDDT